MRTLLRMIALAIAMITPPVAGLAAFVKVSDTSISATMSQQDSTLHKDRCSWYCHNRNCPHEATLPPELTGDEGAFGMTISALVTSGRSTGLGYQGMNIIVFCVVWPLVTYFLYFIAVARAIWSIL